MIRINHHLTKKQLVWLRAESDRTGLTVAELIRRAVDAMRTKPEKPKEGKSR